MNRNFTPEQKAKIVLEILQGKMLNEIAAEYEIHPNRVNLIQQFAIYSRK